MKPPCSVEPRNGTPWNTVCPNSLTVFPVRKMNTHNFLTFIFLHIFKIGGQALL
jgi:hypothetical protein